MKKHVALRNTDLRRFPYQYSQTVFPPRFLPNPPPPSFHCQFFSENSPFNFHSVSYCPRNRNQTEGTKNLILKLFSRNFSIFETTDFQPFFCTLMDPLAILILFITISLEMSNLEAVEFFPLRFHLLISIIPL